LSCLTHIDVGTALEFARTVPSFVVAQGRNSGNTAAGCNEQAVFVSLWVEGTPSSLNPLAQSLSAAHRSGLRNHIAHSSDVEVVSSCSSFEAAEVRDSGLSHDCIAPPPSGCFVPPLVSNICLNGPLAPPSGDLLQIHKTSFGDNCSVNLEQSDIHMSDSEHVVPHLTFHDCDFEHVDTLFAKPVNLFDVSEKDVDRFV
jgi:hypothetical protein